MKLLYSPASPFVAKVRLAARHAGVAMDYVKVDAAGEQKELLENNPLGKIPCLLLDNGQAIFDSKVIMRELDRQSGGKLFPSDQTRLLHAELLESTADGISDCAVAAQYELRMRPEEKIHQPWFDRQWGKVCRGLDYLNEHCPPINNGVHAGHFALAALLGYLNLRYEGKWQEGRPALVEWQREFASQMPFYDELKPAA